MGVIIPMNKKILIGIIALIIIIICVGVFAMTNNQTGSASTHVDANALENRGNLVVDSQELSSEKGYYSSLTSDENGVLVKNGGVLKLVDSFINKTGDIASTGDDADFYGINSAVLVNSNGSLDISNVEIETNYKGFNGILLSNGESSGTSSEASTDGAVLDGNGLVESREGGSSEGNGSDAGASGDVSPSMPDGR